MYVGAYQKNKKGTGTCPQLYDHRTLALDFVAY